MLQVLFMLCVNASCRTNTITLCCVVYYMTRVSLSFSMYVNCKKRKKNDPRICSGRFVAAYVLSCFFYYYFIIMLLALIFSKHALWKQYTTTTTGGNQCMYVCIVSWYKWFGCFRSATVRLLQQQQQQQRIYTTYVP